MMAEIWSTYNSYARASHVSVGNSKGHSPPVSKEDLVTVIGKDSQLLGLARYVDI